MTCDTYMDLYIWCLVLYFYGHFLLCVNSSGLRFPLFLLINMVCFIEHLFNFFFSLFFCSQTLKFCAFENVLDLKDTIEAYNIWDRVFFRAAGLMISGHNNFLV
jgi:hypothetical protein